MARSLGTRLHLLGAAMLMAVMGLLFSVPAQAHADRQASSGPVMTMVATEAAGRVASAPGCMHSGHGTIIASCCLGTACLTMHSGVVPVPLSSMPSRIAALRLPPTGSLDEGIAPLPARKPPRATV